MSKKREKRVMPPDFKSGGVVVLMGTIDGYAMVRRPHCVPFVVDKGQWLSWPIAPAQPNSTEDRG